MPKKLATNETVVTVDPNIVIAKSPTKDSVVQPSSGEGMVTSHGEKNDSLLKEIDSGTRPMIKTTTIVFHRSDTRKNQA